MTRNRLVLTLLLVISAFAFSSKTPSSVCAGWTCCTEDKATDGCAFGQNGCAVIPSCGIPSSVSCPGAVAGCCPTEIKTEQCGAGKVSNACDTAGGGTVDGALCKWATVTPKSATIKVNQTLDLASNAYANGLGSGISQIDSMKSVSSSPSVATVSPTTVNLCCNWKDGWRMSGPNLAPVITTVTALREGVTNVRSTFVSAQTTSVCYSSSAVTVKGVADPLVCVPGAKCVSNTGKFSAGAVVTCSMPVVTTPTGSTTGYYMSCAPFKGTLAQSIISNSSANGTFKVFTIASGVTSVSCKFRYCQKVTATGVTTCSNWGTI